MTVNEPAALLFFLLLLPVIWLGRPSRGFDRKREVVSLTLRLILLACIILALAGLQLINKTDNLAVVFLLDVSDSMSNTSRTIAIDYIRDALKAMGPDDQAALITFGGNALVDHSMSSLRELQAIRSVPVTSQTDLAEAIQLAMALFPNNAARRMVILSDGRMTTGNAQIAAQYAATSGIEIIALPFYASLNNEVLISNAQAPNYLAENERFNINATIEASQPGMATIRVSSNGQIVYQGEYTINRGTQTISLPLIAGAPGFTSYLIQLESENDTYYQNNEQYAYAQIAGPPTILVVTAKPGEVLGPDGQTRPDESTYIIQVLKAARLEVQSILPTELPSELPLLAEYKAIVLIDVPARQLTNQQMEALQTYIRDLGGGFVAIGGPTSYGVGGYYRTPLEEILPVDMQIKDEQRRASLAIVFVIDHSGSMSETSGGATKVELAKEAAIRSIELLGPTDRVGVVAFDDTASWVVEMTDLQDRQAVINAIGTIRSGGGTDILAGLQAMSNVLPEDKAKVKHVILLTDGGADPSGIPELVQQLYSDYGITLSTVGVGRDAAPYLQELADLGGGRYHFTAEPATIPSIFTEETTLATRAYLIEETFYPQLSISSPIMTGIEEVPPLHGYVGTSGKDTAQVVLISGQGDPILAAWQYGLGRSIAFTSDATSRWASDWIHWDGFSVFWSQVISYVAARQTPSQLEVSITHNGEQAQIIVDAHQINMANEPNDQEYFLNGYTMLASIVGPDRINQIVSLRQTAPGHYVGEFYPNQQGVYLVHVTGTSEPEENQGLLTVTSGWVLSYSPEYRSLESDPDALYRIVVSNGGRIASQNPADVFAHTLSSPPTLHPAWPALIYAALLLLPLDIALRRLVLTRSDLLRVLAKIKPSHTKTERTTEITPRSTQIDHLFLVKERTSHRHEETKTRKETTANEAKYATIREEAAPPGEVSAQNQIDSIPDTISKPEETGDIQNTATKLLAHKRTRRGNQVQETEEKK